MVAQAPQGAGRFVTAAAAVFIAFATLMPGDVESPSRICLVCDELGGVDAFLNVLLFVPLGVGLAMLGRRIWTTVAIAVASTIAIEALQFLVAVGRQASIGDVVTNTLGAALGFLVVHSGSSVLRPSASMAARFAAAWSMGWLGVQTLVAYTLTPTLPGAPYYGQIARPASGARVEFPGLVLDAHVDSEPLNAGMLPNAVRLRMLLDRREGATARANVTLSGSTIGRAEIAVISGPSMEGVLSIEQLGEDLIFGLRTGAERLRFRPYEFRVRGAPIDASLDTVGIAGRYAVQSVSFGWESRTAAQHRHFVPRLSWGWILIAPFPMYIDGDVGEAAASAVYLLLLILPAGYWVYLARRVDVVADRTPGDWLAAAGLVAVLMVGLIAVPALFGIRAAAPWEWVVVMGGLVTGAACGRQARTTAKRDVTHRH